MEFDVILKMIFNVIGGLGIFLLGMRYMSEGMQAVAGNRLRKMISLATNNRLVGVGVGTFVTAIIQSSSVTTVMVVGFVNSGFMTLTQSLGVIMGANIGTTITGWILVMKIGKYGLVTLGLAAFFYLFSKKEQWRYIAMAVMGIGMIFFGLELMKLGFKPIRSIPEFSEWFQKFSADNYFGVLKCAAVGCLLTMIVQSSSATLGITISLATTGIIHFNTAAALVLGENIGTTITALLASLGTTTNAKRAAYFHSIFNILGVIWITALFFVYVPIVTKVVGLDNPDDPVMVQKINTETKEPIVDQKGNPVMEETFPHRGRGIAAVHTGFNVINVLIFIPLAGYIAAFLKKVVPEKQHKEAPHLTQLDTRLLESPVIGIEQSRVELLRMSDGVARMLELLRTVLSNGDANDAVVRKIFHREEVMDIMQKEITIFLADFLSMRLPHSYTDEGRLQLRMADEYESVSDYIANILKSYLRMKNESLRMTEDEKKSILDLHGLLEEYISLINQGLVNRNPDVISKAHSLGDAITHKLRELRNKHIAQMTEIKINPLVSSSYSDMLNSYRRVRDHGLNIAEALAGQK